MKYWKYYLLALLVILIDQVSKWAVHAYMEPGMPGEIPLIGDWFKLHYTLNPGMAFGVELPAPYGKIILTTFRLVAVTFIAYLIRKHSFRHTHPGLLACVGLILGGAIGNLIDSMFYGVIYNNAPFEAPTPWLHGQVIDMIYLDLYEGFLPMSWPLIGGISPFALAYFQHSRLRYLHWRGPYSAQPKQVFPARRFAHKNRSASARRRADFY